MFLIALEFQRATLLIVQLNQSTGQMLQVLPEWIWSSSFGRQADFSSSSIFFFISLSLTVSPSLHTHTHTHTHTHIYIYISFSIFCFLWRWLKGELTSCLAEKFVFYFSAGSYAAATMVVDKLMWIGRLKRIRSEIISRELDALIGWWKWQSEVWNLDGFFCFVLFFLSFFLFLFLSPCRFHLKVINGVNFNAFTHLLNIESEFFGAWN